MNRLTFFFSPMITQFPPKPKLYTNRYHNYNTQTTDVKQHPVKITKGFDSFGTVKKISFAISCILVYNISILIRKEPRYGYS